MKSSEIAVITFDGNSGVGKGTVAQRLAKKMGWHYLDSGKLYRILAFDTLKYGQDLAFARFNKLDIKFQDSKTVINGTDISNELLTDDISMTASKLAQLKEARNLVDALNHTFRKQPGLVADGRDMGSNVFRSATLKFFMTASPEVRAERRYKQLQAMNFAVNYQQILDNIKLRDKNDIERDISPTQSTKKSIIIDTTNLDVTQVFLLVWDIVIKSKNISTGK